MAGKLIKPKYSTKLEATGAGKIVDLTTDGKPIHFTYEKGLGGKDALEASKHHERKFNDYNNLASTMKEKGFHGLHSHFKEYAKHHIQQSKKYANDHMSKSDTNRMDGEPRIKADLESKLKTKLLEGN